MLNASNSPHLALTLDQLVKSGELDEPAAAKILMSFETALSQSAGLEIGFCREVGQSFNPRPARVLLILLKDAQVREANMLLQASQRAGLGENYPGYLNLEEPLVVSAAFLLDRLRHLHLEKNENFKEIYDACLKAGELLSREFPQLSILLEKGVVRMKRNIS